jgi:hypothetical protein
LTTIDQSAAQLVAAAGWTGLTPGASVCPPLGPPASLAAGGPFLCASCPPGVCDALCRPSGHFASRKRQERS